ncbi:MAG: hypothetical protein H7841_04765 [Magnetospirillum sp. WYHS-4]
MSSAVVTVRLGQETKSRLESLSKATRRSKSFLAAEAIERYVADEAAFIAAVEEGIAAAERGELVSHEDILADLDRHRAQRRGPA